MTSDSSPQQLGHYQLLRLLGRGGMGEVWLAHDPRLDREVAIKRLRVERDNDDFLQRLRREARLLAKVNHPNVVQVYDVIDAGSELALVMEYVAGGSLRHWLRAQQPDLSGRLNLLAQVAQGLAAAHRRGIVHRDLKLDNLLVDSDGRVKVADFGIAKGHIASDNTIHTEAGMVSGSYTAMSPEQAQGQKLDFRSDLFALGLLIYRVLTGEHPFGDDKAPLVMVGRLLNEEHRPLQDAFPELPIELSQLVDQLLAKNPAMRPESAEQVAQLLVNISELAVAADPSTLMAVPALALDTTMRPLSSTPQTTEEKETTAPENPLPSLRWGGWLVGLAMLLVAVSGGWVLNDSEALFGPELRVVAIPEPVVIADDPDLIKAAVHNGLMDAALALENIELIDPDEVREIPGSAREIGKVVGADEIVRSQLECHQRSCQLQVARINTVDAKVLWQRQIPILLDQLWQMDREISALLLSSYPDRGRIKASQTTIESEEDYRRYLRLLVDFHEGADLEKVTLELQALIKEWPRFEPAYHLYTMACIAIFRQKEDESWLLKLGSSLTKVSGLVNESPMMLRNKVELLIARKAYEQAEQAILKMQSLGVGQADILLLRGELLFDKGQLQRSLEALNESIELRSSWHGRYRRALIYMLTGRLEQSHQELDDLLSIYPGNASALGLKGDLALYQGNFDQGIIIYKKLLKKGPNNIYNLGNMGLVYMLSGDYENAYSVFQQLHVIEPDLVLNTLNLADTLTLLGRLEEAQVFYQAVIDHLSLDVRLRTWLDYSVKAQALAHMGEPVGAIDALQHVLMMAPESGDAAMNAALVYEILGERSSALVHLKRAIKAGLSGVWLNLPWLQDLAQDPYIQAELSDSAPRRG